MDETLQIPTFPELRGRRLRRNEILRELIKETDLEPNDFIMPIFIKEGSNIVEEIGSMPGVFRYSIDNALKFIDRNIKLGIKSFLLFGIPSYKDEQGTAAYSKDGIIYKAVKEIKKKFPEIIIATDVCLCEYTSHGHCGIIRNGDVDNDATLELLAKAALTYAEAGADIVAPSAMMDGQVKAIRKILDENGFKETIIMSYSAKYASNFYGPFREAADSKPMFGNRKSYQMDYRNAREAIREIQIDINEGADIVMVKPALAYLDIIRIVRENFNHPIAAYNVSGEYAMVKAASSKGWINEKEIILEILHAIKRAGADIIITYFAEDAAKWLKSTIL